MTVVNQMSQTPVIKKKTRRGLSAAQKAKKRKLASKDVAMHESDDTGSEAEGDELLADVNAPSSSAPVIAMTHMLEEEEGDAPMAEDDAPQSSPANFAPLPASAQQSLLKGETRRISIPPHRFAPLKRDWINIYSPLTEILGLQVRMNVQRKAVEIRVYYFVSHLFESTHVITTRRRSIPRK